MITIKNRFTGVVMFASSDQSQSLRDFILELIKKRANLSGANLSWVDLSGACLSDANLSGVDLSGATLSGANLSGANLSWVDLSGANLSWANLSWVDLSGACLSGACLSDANLSGATMPIFCKWSSHGIVDGKIRIGCEIRSVEDWDSFFASDEVITTPRDTDEFKRIRAVYESYKYYLTFLN